MIEKLGIKREIIQELAFDCACKNCGEKNEIKIDIWKPTVAQQFASEMLEALIESLMKAEELNSIIIEFDQDMLKDIYKQDKRVIAVEKATGKTWEDIKKLLEEL